ncbi:MAG: hypothetical protein KF830_01155 [Planctomycetes bacterium]|nr:hypothetical protein [Planctomycetota bacterium]
MHYARHLAAGAHPVARALRRRGREVWPLRRRGADLGYAVPVHRRPPDLRQALARWQRSEAVFLPGMLGDGPARHGEAIAASLRMFDRLRRGGSFLDELDRRLRDDADLRYAGSTADRNDRREIERVFVDAMPGGERVASDLWAKLTWIADDASDRSLRIRFSAGLEQLEEWMQATDLTAGWVDQFAARAFPEGAAILGCEPLRRLLQALLDRPHRLSERIVYNNAPDGGAVFHHDAEPGQLGVVFSQLEGRTGWLAIGKRRLAALLAPDGSARARRQAMAALDRGDDQALWRRLNRDAAFAGLLAAHGALFVLQAGDVILLPSQGIDDVAWHSVTALGRRPSLAHSYGLFPRRDDYPVAADPWSR